MRQRYQNLIVNHPLLVLLLSIVITVFLGREMLRVNFSSSSEDFFIKGDPEKEYFNKAKKLFGNDQVVSIALIVPEGEDIYNSRTLEKLDRLTDEIEDVEGVEATVSLANIPSIEAPWDPEAGEYKKTIKVRPLIDEVPRTDEEWNELKQKIDNNPLYKDNLVSEDGRAVSVIAFIRDLEKNPALDYKMVMSDIKTHTEKEEGPENVYVVGVPETRVEIVKRMVKDLRMLLPLTIALIFITLVLSFRNVRGVLLPLVTVLMITVWAVGFMEVVEIPVSLVTLILPPLMLALGSSYSIHMMSEYLAEARADLEVKEVVRECLYKVSLPVAVCGFTTMIGFGSLILNRIPAIQDLGRAAVAGIFFAVVVALFAAPSMLMLMKKPGRAQESKDSRNAVDRFLERLGSFNTRHPRGIFAAAVIIVLVSITGISRVKIDTDFLHFFSKDDPVMKAVDAQVKHLAGAAPFNIVLESERSEVFNHPSMLKRIEDLQKWATKEVKGIDTTLSMADYVKLLNQAMHKNDPAYYTIPDTKVGVNQLLFLYATSGSPEDFAPYVTPDYSAANILIRSRLVGSTETNRAIARIEEKAVELFKAPARMPAAAAAGPGVQAPVPIRKEGTKDEEVSWEEDEPADHKMADEEISWDEEPSDQGAADEEISWEEEDTGEQAPAEEEITREDDEPGSGQEEGQPEQDTSGDEEILWEDDEEEEPEDPGQDAAAENPGGKNTEQANPEDGEKKADRVPLAAVGQAEDYLPCDSDFAKWPKIDVHVTGTIYLMNRSADAVSKGQITGLVTALLAIILVMSLLFLSLKIGLLAMLPNLFPIFLLFGIMGFSGITLNFSTSLIAAIALGIGVDDTIHYINRYNWEVHRSGDQTDAMKKALVSMGKPMVYTSVALFFGFIIFLLSDFVPVRQFGILTAVTIMIALCANLVILPTLMFTVRIITLWDLVGLEIGTRPSEYIKIFHGLTNHQARVAVLMGKVAEYQDGQQIIQEEEVGSEMYVVLKGRVNIFKSQEGKEVSITDIEPGDAFGEMALLRDTIRSASARAKGPVKLLVLDKHLLERLEKRYPKISSKIFFNITQMLSDRLQATTDQLLS